VEIVDFPPVQIVYSKISDLIETGAFANNTYCCAYLYTVTRISKCK